MDASNMTHLSPMRDSYIQRLFENADRIEALKDKHNVSISITEACSPDGSLKKERHSVHLRSNSDVTLKCVCPTSPAPPRALPLRKSHPRSHSLGARPGQKHAMKHQSLSIPVQRSSMGHLAIEFSPHVEISTLSSILAKCEKSVTPKYSPRRICSERTSPNVSVISIVDANPILLKVSPMVKDKSSSQLVYVPSDPWTKMSDKDPKNHGKLARPNHHSLDYSSVDAGPWVLHDSVIENSQSQRRIYRKSRSLTKQKNYFDSKRQESLPSALQISNSDAVSKSDRCSPISCGSCWSNDSCKCLKSNVNNMLKNSPVSDNKPFEVVLSCQASPSHFYTDQMYGKKSPVILKNQSKTLLEASNKLDPACLCSKSLQSSSPRPSPRRILPKITCKSDSIVDGLEITDKDDNKKAAIVENCIAENSKTATEVLQSEKDSSNTDNRSPKSISVCDPLLETTC